MMRKTDSDIQNELRDFALVGNKDQPGMFKNAKRIMRNRRRSADAYSVGFLASLTAKTMGESKMEEDLSHA